MQANKYQVNGDRIIKTMIVANGSRIPAGRAVRVKPCGYCQIRDHYKPMKGAFRPPSNSHYEPSGDYIALGDFWMNEPKELEDVERILAKCNRKCDTRAEAGIISTMWSVFIPLEEVQLIDQICDFLLNIGHPLSLRTDTL